jgi:hypothetical protein
MAAKRMAQHKAITMNLITRNARGCLGFLDFLLLAILNGIGELKVLLHAIKMTCSKFNKRSNYAILGGCQMGKAIFEIFAGRWNATFAVASNTGCDTW